MKKTGVYLLLFFVCIGMPQVAGADTLRYRNPVIPGFHPDPSVCCVGDDYYLVTSSFEYFPGVPVFHSKDLINWKQIGHCLTRDSQLPIEKTFPSGGIYAPTIRYHEGRFYMVTTNVSGGGNFFVHTDNPAGEWSDPLWVKQKGIDPSLFFEDGKCYFISNGDGEGLILSEIDIKTGKLLTEPRVVWKGTGGRYPEAPHIYKKDGWYYLLIAEGGTEYGHKVTIARSRTIYGPYDSNPANPILTHIDEHTQSNPIQGVGHADFVQAHDGSWWTVFLGFRTQSGTHHLLGRETFLAPVRWDANAWPVINGNGSVSLEMSCPTLPRVPAEQLAKRNDFNDPLGFEWNYLRNPIKSNYSSTERKGYLRLKPTTIQLFNFDTPTFVGRRQQHIHFTASTFLDFNPKYPGDEAGITVFMQANYHYDLCVVNRDEKKTLLVRYCLGNMQHIEKSIPLPDGVTCLRVTGNPEEYSFHYSSNNGDYQLLCKMNTKFLSSETVGGFTGIYLGLYATSVKEGSKSYADFDWFEYDGK